jgi:TPR repeat protein
MKKILWILTGAVVISGFGLLIIRGIGTRVHSSAETYDLSPSQLIELSSKARDRNDAEAAFRVSQYYMFSHPESQSNMFYYLRIAATNGNMVAQYNLAVHLVLPRDPSKYSEAKFWLEKAAAAGNGDAKKGLQDWDHFVDQWH